MHRFYNPRLEQIILPYIREVNKMERQEIEAINQDLPFTPKEVEFAEFIGSVP
jgi:predicted N-acyltransferase